MAFRFNISDSKGKSWKIEAEAEHLAGKSVENKIDGKEVSADLKGYELEITGGSDQAGFPLSKSVEGIGLKRLLLKKGWGMRENKPKGLRRRKTVRGKIISSAVVQINLKVIKEGSKKLAEIFPEQNKSPEQRAVEKPAELSSEDKAKDAKEGVKSAEQKAELQAAQ